MIEQPPIVVWFRDDLRLADHPALDAAARTGAPLICVYVFDNQSSKSGLRPLGGASLWWLARSLQALSADLEAKGAKLILRKGSTANVLVDIARESHAQSVYWNDIAIEACRDVTRDVATSLSRIGVEHRQFHSDLLTDPSQVRNKEGRGLRVFTPFWKRVIAIGDPPKPLLAPKKIKSGPHLTSDRIEDWNLEPTKPDWAGGLRDTWTPGEASAVARLREFLADDIRGYATGRDHPDREVTSRLSPHLRFGEISPRQVWHAAQFAVAERPAIANDVSKFLSEVGWREFSRHLLFDHPDLAEKNLQSSFDAFPWKRDAKAFKAWTRGQTGYPLVDAGMRQLWHTGIMHNRVRMVVASFLVKHLLVDWREGEKWFWDTLVDADPGSNPASWQWVAGSGADAAPYFRIFNPVLQGEKFDPNGQYVRRWVPELAEMPSKLIHKPWDATPLELASAGVTLGKTYPEPIVDHPKARERALAAYAKTRD